VNRALLGLGLLVLLVIGCGGDKTTGPVAGDLTLILATPGTSDGAVLVRLTGPIESITPASGYLLESEPLSGGMTRFVIVGSIVAGPIARIRVPDINAVGTYLTLVEQVADRNTFALLSTAGYTVSVSK